AEDGIRDWSVTGVQTCALPISIFFGSYDWHSCVHGYWLLARLMRRYPDFAHADAIATLFDERITDTNVAAEVAYLERPTARGFRSEERRVGKECRSRGSADH